MSVLPDPLILTTECDEAGVPALHQALAAAPGVRSVSLVAAYRDSHPQEDT